MSTLESKMFNGRREKVRDYIMNGMIAQGVSSKQADDITMCVYRLNKEDVENLFKCIISDLPQDVISAIVAHDYNGLARGDVGFLPKSSQFKTLTLDKAQALS